MDTRNDLTTPHSPQTLLIECPECKQPGFVEAWPKITSTVDERATQLLKERKLFQYTCPVCQKTAAMTYDCVYHDVDHHMFLLYTTDPKADEEAPKLLEGLMREAEAARWSEKVTYQARLVKTTFELSEKVRIMDDGYDDRVIELMKVGIKRGMVKEGIIGARDILIYERTMPDGGVSFVVTGEIPGDVVGMRGGYDYCERFLAEAEAEGKIEGRYRFDAAWANAFLP